MTRASVERPQAASPRPERAGQAMIVVLGTLQVRRGDPDGRLLPAGLAAEVALAIGRQGGAVEVVGSIGDDPEGDAVVVELGRAGVGHAALLRDPALRTSALGAARDDRRRSRYDAADIELGLRYLPGCRVIVITDILDDAELQAALAGAEFHAAAVVIVAPPGSIDATSLGDAVTLLEHPRPEDDEDAADDSEVVPDEAAFAAFIADYALRLDRGETPAEAFGRALGDGAWERSPD